MFLHVCRVYDPGRRPLSTQAGRLVLVLAGIKRVIFTTGVIPQAAPVISWKDHPDPVFDLGDHRRHRAVRAVLLAGRREDLGSQLDQPLHARGGLSAPSR